MKNKAIKVGGCVLTQLNETEFEYENLEQGLDFHFVVEKSDEVTVIIFDSLLPTNNQTKSDLGVFTASNLEEAVSDVRQLTKDNLKNSIMWT
jgi:hypothetical protein